VLRACMGGQIVRGLHDTFYDEIGGLDLAQSVIDMDFDTPFVLANMIYAGCIGQYSSLCNVDLVNGTILLPLVKEFLPVLGQYEKE
jgi:hypothetical protein